MNRRTLGGEAALLLASIIWGFAFVAQRIGADHVGAFFFNAARFGLGALTILPLAALGIANRPSSPGKDESWKAGMLAGVCLFGGSWLQQAGMARTTAGKASFITALYVVLVPLLGLFARHRPKPSAWIGAGFAVVGLYFLSIQGSVRMAPGDGIVLGATIFWALHILLVSHFVSRIRLMTFAFVQCATAAAIHGALASMFEHVEPAAARAVLVPVLYAGVLSSGVAFTLQIIGQRPTPPAPAAIILALESVFGAVGGALLLGESMTARQILGCALMLCGVLVSQLGSVPYSSRRRSASAAM